MATIPGTPGNDDLTGTSDGDYINGLGGDDQIEGLGGNDTLLGGEGANDISGGDGNDHITSGDSGYGFVSPGLGDDTIVGVQNDLEGADLSYLDITIGGVIVDIAAGTTDGVGFSKHDVFNGVHRVEGTDSADTLRGSDVERWEGFDPQGGDDSIDGRGGFDELLYHQEDGIQGISVNFSTGIAIDTFGDTDTFTNMEGVRATLMNDTLTGSDQEFEAYRALGGADIISGGDGIDLADYSDDEEYGGTGGISANLSTGIITDGFGDIDTVSGIEEVRGTGFGDTIYGDTEDNHLEGRGGNDTLRGGGGNDTVFGDDGADRIEGNADADTLGGGDGVDFFEDSLAEYNGDVILDFAAGETLSFQAIGAGWTASLVGELLSIDGDGDGDIDATITLVGAAGRDLIISGDTLTLAPASGGGGGAPPSPPITGDGPDFVRPDDASTIVYAMDGNDQVYGGGGDDTLFSGSGDDRTFGGLGNDDVYGGIGNDVVGGGAGDDDVFAGQGDDTVYGGLGQDHAFGGAGSDLLYLAAGNDQAFGGAGDDRMYGGEGNDTLYGGVGNDELYGGAGSDVYGFVSGSGDDVIYGFGAGDKIALNGQTYTSGLNAAGDLVLTLDGGGTIVIDGATTVDASWFI